jgi:hypothetical protein
VYVCDETQLEDTDLQVAGTSEEDTGFDQAFQAEDGTYSGGVNTDARHDGYNGTGFADYPGGQGRDVNITWQVEVPEAGQYDFIFRYALGSSDRPLNLYVNGERVGEVPFSGTGAWTSYLSVTLADISLEAGENTIELVADAGSPGPNVDAMRIVTAGTGN